MTRVFFKKERTSPDGNASGLSVRMVAAEERGKWISDVRKIYLAAGWIENDEDADFLNPMLENTFALCGAFAPDGRMVGMMRTLSDGVSDAYLLDMAVLPEFRGRGLASRILDVLTEYLKSLGIDWIVCVSVPGVEKLYSRTGKRMDSHVPFRF